MLAGINAANAVLGREEVIFSADTAIGALSHYVSNKAITDFQPMNVNFGIMTPPPMKIKDKREKAEYFAKRSFEETDRFNKGDL